MALEDASELGKVCFEARWRIDVRVLEEEAQVCRLLRLGRGCPAAPRLLRLGPDRLGHLVGEDPGAPQVARVAPDALALLLFLDALEVDVRLWVIRRRVRRGPVADRLDERRPLTRTGARNGFARRLVYRQDVEPVH